MRERGRDGGGGWEGDVWECVDGSGEREEGPVGQPGCQPAGPDPDRPDPERGAEAEERTRRRGEGRRGEARTKTSATLQASNAAKQKTSATLHGSNPAIQQTSATLHGNPFFLTVSLQQVQIGLPKNVPNHYFYKLLDVVVMPS